MSPHLWEPLCRSLCISTSGVDWCIGVWDVSGVVTWSGGGGDVVNGAVCSFESILFCPIYFSFFVEHATLGVFCFCSSHNFWFLGMTFVTLLTSGVWGAVGVAAKVVIGGYLHSSGISHFLDVSNIVGISDICFNTSSVVLSCPHPRTCCRLGTTTTQLTPLSRPRFLPG